MTTYEPSHGESPQHPRFTRHSIDTETTPDRQAVQLGFPTTSPLLSAPELQHRPRRRRLPAAQRPPCLHSLSSAETRTPAGRAARNPLRAVPPAADARHALQARHHRLRPGRAHGRHLRRPRRPQARAVRGLPGARHRRRRPADHDGRGRELSGLQDHQGHGTDGALRSPPLQLPCYVIAMPFAICQLPCC